MKPLLIDITSGLSNELQDFLNSDLVIILCVVCLILIVVIGIVIFKLYTQTQEINRALTKKATEWAKPIPEELRDSDNEEE